MKYFCVFLFIYICHVYLISVGCRYYASLSREWTWLEIIKLCNICYLPCVSFPILKLIYVKPFLFTSSAKPCKRGHEIAKLAFRLYSFVPKIDSGKIQDLVEQLIKRKSFWSPCVHVGKMTGDSNMCLRRS